MRDDVMVREMSVGAGRTSRLRTTTRQIVAAMRPRQWAKNVLVFAAPAAAGKLTQPAILGRSVAAFVALTLCSAATYIVNDVIDAPWDARHPTKRFRPIASGALAPRIALVAAGAAGATGIGISVLLGWPFIITALGYLALSIGYSVALKHVAVVEFAAVAGGFVLRAVGGGAATHVTPSAWFLILVSCASVLMVTGKRVADARMTGDDGFDGSHNVSYPMEYLSGLWVLAAGGAITSYCLWAFAVPHLVDGVAWSQISIVPFTLGVLKYGLVVQEGSGGVPETVVLRDRLLQAIGVAWIVTYAIGVYGR